MIGRLKKINKKRDILDRDKAICYLDGKFYINTKHNFGINKHISQYGEDINQAAFAHLLYSYTDSDPELAMYNTPGQIFIELDSLQNIDLYTAGQIFKEHFPDYEIYCDDTDEKLARLKKKAWLSERDNNRKFAILYADGKIYTGYTHAECAEEYKKEFNAFDIKNGAFAYMGNDNNIYLADDFLYGYTKNDLPQIAQDLKQKYPNSNIYYDSTSHFDTDLNEQHEQVARLKRVAEDSCSVEPNGVLWNDNLWDTYDNSLVNKQKSNINREWLFEQPIDNQEWNLQEN